MYLLPQLVGKIDSFAYVIGFTCANTVFLHTSGYF